MNPYRILWFHVPGMESIRAPFRVQVFLYALIAYFLLRSVELWWTYPKSQRSTSWARHVALIVACATAVLIIVEMQRPVQSDWTRAQLLAPALEAQIGPARASCDAAIVVDENSTDSVFMNPIDAVIFSALSGLPTPQGYSRADPIGHPGPRADPARLAEWMRSREFTGRVCAITAGSVDRI